MSEKTNNVVEYTKLREQYLFLLEQSKEINSKKAGLKKRMGQMKGSVIKELQSLHGQSVLVTTEGNKVLLLSLKRGNVSVTEIKESVVINDVDGGM